MSEPQLIQRPRAVFRELARLAAHQQKSLAEAQALNRQRLETADRDLQEARRKLTARLEAEQAAAQQEGQKTRQAALARCESEQAAAKLAYGQLRDTSKRRCEESRDKAERAHEEQRWTTTTMLEADEKAAKAPFEKVQQEVAGANLRMDALREEVHGILRGWKHGGVIARTPAAGKANRYHEELARNLKRCLTDSEELLAEFKALRVPRLFQWKYLLGLLLVLWAVLGGVLLALFPSGLVGGKYHWLLVSGGAVLLLEVAFASFVYGLARVKLLAIYKPFRTALADAELTGQRWLEAAGKKFRAQQVDLAARRKQVEATLAQAEDKHQRLLASLQQRHEQELAQAEAKYPPLLASLTPRRDAELAQADERQQKLLAEARQKYDADLRFVEDRARKLTEQAQQELAQVRATITEAGKKGLTQCRDALTAVIQQAAQRFPPWNSPAWQQWQPPQGVPDVLRFGEFEVALEGMAGEVQNNAAWFSAAQTRYALPALMPFPQRASLLLQTRDAGRQSAVTALQAMMCRYLTALPAGKVRFTIIDPVGLGENFAAFMHLADHDEQLVGSKIWTERQHIEQRLADVSAHMENVIQKYLRNQYATIEDYNKAAGEVAEPYRVLVVANFPANFTPEAARRLVSIAASGPSCGVYVLVSLDGKQPLPDGFHAADLDQACHCLTWNGSRFQWKEPDFGAFPLTLDAPPDAKLLNHLMQVVGSKAKEASRVEVPFDFIAPAQDTWWRGSSQKGVEVPLGRAGATKRQYLRLGQGTAQHGLIAGKTGSGKSTLLHVLITNACLCYSPDELELYLVDFKKGVEFKTYATHQLPHARVIAIESEREFGLSVLQRLDAELKQRGERFRQLDVQNLADFRAATGQPCPRILLLVDEFQEFFVEDDKLAQEAALLLDRLVRQGRAFGLHVLLGSQTLGGAYSLARATIDQMAVRIALQCSEADAHLILSKDNSAARLLTRPGEAIYNDQNGLMEGNDIFQVVWLGDDRREGYLKHIREMNRQRTTPAAGQIVFEGNLPAEIRRNPALHRLLVAPTAPVLPVPTAWLGEAVAIKDATAAAFRRQTSHNLLLIGQQEEAALGVLSSALLALVAQSAAPAELGVRFQVLDATPADAPQAGWWQKLVQGLPHAIPVAGWRELPAALGDIAVEVDRRQKANDSESPAIFLFIHGLQRFKDLRKQEDDYSFGRRGEEAPAVHPSKHLETILKEGPAVGVHALIWCDSLNSLQRAFDRPTMREFAQRVLFQMSVNDSSFLIDTPQASKLGVHRALYCNEDAGTVEKFRPYGLPGDDWLGGVRQALAARKPACVGAVGRLV